MSDPRKIIVGAGYAGLIAACAYPKAEIVERGPERAVNHKALLRFRALDVARLTRIPFERVVVNKSIWFENRHYDRANILMANMYSRKVSGRIDDRSIWNLERSSRYIAPRDFYEQLVDRVGSRLHWNEEFDFAGGKPAIVTAPLPVVASACGVSLRGCEFIHQAVHVARIDLGDLVSPKLSQTVYFPSDWFDVYRASIVAGELIIEYVPCSDLRFPRGLSEVFRAFGIYPEEIGIDPLNELPQEVLSMQEQGKIVPIDNAARRIIIGDITESAGHYMLGRYATWRSVLLDDLPNDIDVIDRFVKSDRYARRKAAV